MKRTVTFALIAALTGPALAHEQGGRAMGEVESISPVRIVVRTSDGHAVPFSVTKETRFLAGDKPGRAEDVHVGQRVVVHGKREGDGLRALQVKLAPQPAPK